MLSPFYYLFFSCFLLSAYVVTSIRWEKSGFVESQSNHVSISQATTKGLKFDVFTGEQVVIRKDTISKFEIEIFCFVSGYNSKSNIEYMFCKDYKCESIKEGGTGKVLKNENIVVNYDSNFKNKKGIKLNFQFLMTDTYDTSGNYYCKANDIYFASSIQSTRIQIRDTKYWNAHLFKPVISQDLTSINTVTSKNLPQVFKCQIGLPAQNLPSWIDMELIYKVGWTICPVLESNNTPNYGKMNPFRCKEYSKIRCESKIDPRICPKTIDEVDDWDSLQNRDGSLIITRLKKTSKPPSISYMLMCFVKEPNNEIAPVTTYFTSKNAKDFDSGILFDGREQTVNQDLKLISPEVQEVNIFAIKIENGKTNFNPSSIIILYHSNSNAKYIWQFKGIQINSNSVMSLERYSIKFIGSISPDMEGDYKLTVTQPGKSITAIVNVKVLGNPEVKRDNCISPVRYVEEWTSVWMSCDYINRPETLMLKINNQEIRLGSPLTDSQTQLGSVYPFLSALDFNWTSSESKTLIDTVSMNYSVTNMRKSNIGLKYQDHSVTFLVSNKYGLSIRSSSIYVVPKLSDLIIDRPEKYNCTNNCLSTSKHFFKCKIQMEAFDNKELEIDQFWSVENYRLDDNQDKANPFARYFIVDPVTKDLTMLPIKSNDTDNDKSVINTLKNSFIEYQVIIKGSSDARPIYSYYSRNDASVRQSLRARITLDYEAASASIYWIIALILILLILIIIIILLVRYCRGNKGESYPLDKLERKHGYDPEKEVQEELFKPYEREEHDPDMANGALGERRLSMTNQSVGSGEDGELDNYDLDHTKFNEDGSIIGAYGANPRNRTDMA